MKIATKNATYEVIDYNIYKKDELGLYQLWITRTNGSSIMIYEADNENEISIIKMSLDKATNDNVSLLEL